MTYSNAYTLAGKELPSPPPDGPTRYQRRGHLAATQAAAKDFVEALWDAPVPSGQLRYYDGMLSLLSTLHCSERFRI
jgi:oligosaccharide reducing-end xylanase